MILYKKKTLKYRLQLLIAAFFILIYTSYIPLSVLIDKNRAISFTQLEIDGTTTLRKVRELLINTQKLRGFAVSYKAGNSSLLPQMQQQAVVVKNKLQAVKQVIVERNLKDLMPLLTSLNQKLQNTMNNVLSLSREKVFKNYSDIINDELALIVKIKNVSNLILDSHINTFYLIDVAINKLPLATELAGKLRGLGSAVLILKEVNKNTQVELAILLGGLKENIAETNSSLNSLYLYNISLKPVINPAFEKLAISIKKLKDELTRISKDNFSTNSTQYFKTVTDTINNIVSLYDISNKNIVRLLNIRINGLKVARDEIVMQGIVFLLILIALFYVAYDYLYKNFLVREAAKKEKAVLKELEKTNDSLTYALNHDNLTGLQNRSSLIQDISILQNNTIMMLIDIRAFKEINDVYGNSFGNKILIEFANFLQQFFQKMGNMPLYRIAGDEFAVLVTNKSVDEVMQIGKDLEEAIRNQNFKIDNIRTNLSVNIAINSAAPLLENADLALKALKKDMNRHVIEYKEELSVKKEWKKNIEVINMVKPALVEDRIVPYFQGIVNLKTMKIEKYEALVRLILPSGKVLSPYTFLDTVSKTHYYYDITKVMIKKTMEVAKTHPAQRFSINFSMKDITNKNIIHTLFELFDADKETAKRVDIELLETELVAVDDSRISDFITKVHSYGSKILIDDFGTGYSNFSYLSDLDVDIIKIDASIIKEITSNTSKLHIAQTIHNFTSGMKMQNVAEFVETKEVALLLKEMGVEYAQGYLFSKPLPEPLENSDVSL